MQTRCRRLLFLCLLSVNFVGTGAFVFAGTPPPKPRFVYVGNNQDGTVSTFLVDGVMLRARGYVYLGTYGSPITLTLTPSQKFLYVGSNGGLGISAFAVNAASGDLAPVPGSPFSSGPPLFKLVAHPTANLLLVATGTAVDSYLLDPSSGALTLAGHAGGRSPMALAIHPTGNLVYAINVNNSSISGFKLDTTTGKLTSVAGSPFRASKNNPFAAAIDPAGKFLFVPNVNGGNVSVFAIDAVTGGLTEVPGSPFATGGGPYAEVLSHDGKYLYISNSFDKTISLYAIDGTSGALTQVLGSPYPTGTSAALGLTLDPTDHYLYAAAHDSEEVVTFNVNQTSGALAAKHTVRSRGPAFASVVVSGAQSAGYTPAFAYATNATSNDVSAYSIAAATGVLMPVPGGPFPAGGFPFGVASDVEGHFVFASNNGGGSVSAFTINSATGALSAAPGSPFAAGSQPYAVAVDAGAHFVYVTNNIDSTISGYAVSTSGALTPIPGSPFLSAGLDPLGVAVDPRGKFLYVADAMANSISAYQIDASSGVLTSVGSALAGSFPDSVSIDPTGNFLFATNSSQFSSVSVYAIDGVTGLLSPTFTSTGWGVSYPYFVAADPSGRRVYVGNGSPSEILGFGLNRSTGKLRSLAGFPVTGVYAPYSLSFDLSGTFLYVVNAQGPAPGDSVSGFVVNKSSGALTAVPGSPFAAGQGPTSVTVVDKVR
jgi:6-phosphogluconolactonase (cycloisomerase 2 family)